jgi:hypothetical protein
LCTTNPTWSDPGTNLGSLLRGRLLTTSTMTWPEMIYYKHSFCCTPFNRQFPSISINYFVVYVVKCKPYQKCVYWKYIT